MNQATQDHPLAIAMGAAVPLHIMQLQEKGGPDAADMKRAQETSDMLGERGDVLLHGGGKKGESSDLFNRTAHTVAVLAFVPGGIDIFGQHFEAVRQSERCKNIRRRQCNSGKYDVRVLCEAACGSAWGEPTRIACPASRRAWDSR